jgi:hypothetical protein
MTKTGTVAVPAQKRAAIAFEPTRSAFAASRAACAR